MVYILYVAHRYFWGQMLKPPKMIQIMQGNISTQLITSMRGIFDKDWNTRQKSKHQWQSESNVVSKRVQRIDYISKHRAGPLVQFATIMRMLKWFTLSNFNLHGNIFEMAVKPKSSQQPGWHVGTHNFVCSVYQKIFWCFFCHGEGDKISTLSNISHVLDHT